MPLQSRAPGSIPDRGADAPISRAPPTTIAVLPSNRAVIMRPLLERQSLL
jgi:hypothetical protein